jgi:hypothetical protein
MWSKGRNYVVFEERNDWDIHKNLKLSPRWRPHNLWYEVLVSKRNNNKNIIINIKIASKLSL